MFSLLSEIHFWTTQEDVIVKHSDYGSFKYYSKRDINVSAQCQSKRQYCQQRGIMWNPHNKRPSRMKDKLRELEEHLVQHKIVYFLWLDNKLQLLLSNGIIVQITVNLSTSDINGISFDKHLFAKLQNSTICDGIMIDSQIICICADGRIFGHGRRWRDGWLLDAGPCRKLTYQGEWLVLWGKLDADHPKSPLVKGLQRANLHLYWVGSRGPELLAYRSTEGEPLSVVISKSKRCIILIEQKVTERGAVSVEVSNLELINNTLKTTTITSIPLQTQVSCCSLSHNEDHLIIGCIDGTLALLDRNRQGTNTVKASFIPTLLCWHPLGALVAICNERGQLQYFDTALNCVKSQIVGEECIPSALIDLAGYLNGQFTLLSIHWGWKDIILAFEQGPIVVVTHVASSLSFQSLANAYLTMRMVEKAVALMLSMKFCEESFMILQRIVAQLLKRPFNEEAAELIHEAIGIYYNPPIPLTPSVKNKLGCQVASLTRRFFHNLIRAGLLESAFALALDIGHHDLFMDIHFIAQKLGESDVASSAKSQATALISRTSSQASSESSCSNTSNGNEEESESEHAEDDDESSLSSAQYIPPLSLNCDNFLTTNFNEAEPQTYQPSSTSYVRSSADFAKINSTPKATYVKAPQVPPNFKTNTPKVTIQPPPLPFTSSLPSLLNSNIGIPLVGTGSPFDIYNDAVNKYRTPLQIKPLPLRIPSSFYPGNTLNNNDYNKAKPLLSNGFSSGVKSSFVPVKPTNGTTQPPAVPPHKKPQAKVKFSDTVTAFIVPEVKRPVRPPLPAHITDPQKELQDSLPLCHPNEDYLKDFTPIRKSEPNDNTSSPKIKVVHFGVV